MPVARHVPLADSRATLTLDRARFTLLTDQLIRMEWSEDSSFEDRATLAVCNRRFPVPEFSHRQVGNQLVINTRALTLTWKNNGKPFSPSNLSVVFRHRPGKRGQWKPGRSEKGNLGGTFRTLDGADGNRFAWWQNPDGHWIPDQHVPVDLGKGVVSRDGWALHDDSGRIVLDPAAGQGTPWVTPPREGAHQDWYLFAHGLDFKAALRDAAGLFGAQPLPPRYVFGYWYSRYWAYTDRELEALADKMDEMNLPLDVMVIDMDWHLPGWTGYTWDKRYFPDPARLLARLHKRGLQLTLNLHPADGVGRHEEAFTAICRELDLDPQATTHIPFDATDPAFIKAYFEQLHHPHEDIGVDFWWLDWQQGQKTRLPGLDPLPWLNHLHWTDLAERRPNRRPLCFSRYGGPGAGRYPIGFSGDTYSTWKSLAYQPHFTATAANILYGYWSHDIGGHQPGPVEPELYTRWVQFGVFSPILRTHSGKNMASDRRVWRFPDPYSDIMMDAIRRRYQMVPYIYTECRKATRTGTSLIRAMYIEHPEEPQAYQAPGQYYFGDELIAAPIASPVNASGLAAQKVWLPEGRWYDQATGHLLSGGPVRLQRSYLLDEIPVFMRAGTPIPGQRNVLRLNDGSCKHLEITLPPGDSGTYTLYEDDGYTTGYEKEACTWITLEHTRKARTRSFSWHPPQGSFKGFRSRRSLTLRFEAMPPPAKVVRGSKPLARKEPGTGGDGWFYQGETGTVVVELMNIHLAQPETLSVSAAPRLVLPNGWKGLMARLGKIGELANLVSPAHPLHPDERLAIQVAQTGNRISMNPDSFAQEIRALKTDLKRLPRALKEFQAVYAGHGHDQEQVAILQKARDMLKATLTAFPL